MKTSIYKSAGIPILLSIAGCLVWAILTNYVYPAITAYGLKMSSTFSSSVYTSISAHDLVALQQSTYSLLLLLLVMVSILVCAWAFINMLIAHEDYEISKANFQAHLVKNFGTKSNETNEAVISKAVEDSIIESEEKDKFYKKVYFFNKCTLPSIIIISILIASYSIVTTKYVYEAISYFDYLMGVNAINLNDQTEREYKTRFSQIRTNQDYRNIIFELERKAFNSGLSILPNTTVRDYEDLEQDHPNIKSVYAGER